MKEAGHFETVVKDNQGATWDSPEACDEYMQRLMKSADNLTGRNRKLRAVHAQLGEGICNLLNTDLLRNRQRWFEKVDALKAHFTKEARTNTPESIARWRRHWTEQLFKAFEMQYRYWSDATFTHYTRPFGFLFSLFVYFSAFWAGFHYNPRVNLHAITLIIAAWSWLTTTCTKLTWT